MERIASGEYLLQQFGGDVGLRGCEGIDDERAVLVVDVDAELKSAVIDAVAGLGEENGPRIGGDIDLVAAIGAVGELGVGIGLGARSECVFGGGGRGKNARLEDDLRWGRDRLLPSRRA